MNGFEQTGVLVPAHFGGLAGREVTGSLDGRGGAQTTSGLQLLDRGEAPVR